MIYFARRLDDIYRSEDIPEVVKLRGSESGWLVISSVLKNIIFAERGIQTRSGEMF